MIDVIKRQIHKFNATRELKRYAPKIERASQGLNGPQLVDFVFSEEWQRFFWIKQEPTELKALSEKLQVLRPKVVLEIGTAQGGSLFVFTKLAADDAMIISVDLPDGDFGGGYASYKADFYKSFATRDQQMHLLRADSHSEQTFQSVKEILKGRKIDFLFIDGDHRYDGVKKDYEMYKQLVSNDGLIGFHDIVASTNGCEVHRFWLETRQRYAQYEELVHGPEQEFCGIGLVKPIDEIV